MKNKKMLVATITALAVSLVSMSTISASTNTSNTSKFEIESSKKITAKDGRVVNVTFMKGTKNKISDAYLNDIIESNKDGGNIQILEVGYSQGYTTETAPTTIAKGNFTTAVELPTFALPVMKTVLYPNQLESDRFMDSCAKGETRTLTRTLTAKLGASSDGNVLAKAGLKLNSEISYSIVKGTVLVGPPESSSYNSREYRCKFYKNEGIWERWGMLSGFPYYFWGNFVEPSYYTSYSVDKVVKQ